jgi:hypothetical protein
VVSLLLGLTLAQPSPLLYSSAGAREAQPRLGAPADGWVARLVSFTDNQNGNKNGNVNTNESSNGNDNDDPDRDDEEELGPTGVDLLGYCQSNHARDRIDLKNSKDPTSWICTLRDGNEELGIDLEKACQWQYGEGYRARLARPGDAYSWVCDPPPAA